MLDEREGQWFVYGSDGALVPVVPDDAPHGADLLELMREDAARRMERAIVNGDLDVMTMQSNAMAALDRRSLFGEARTPRLSDHDWSYDERSHRVEIDVWTPQVLDASCEILARRDPGADG